MPVANINTTLKVALVQFLPDTDVGATLHNLRRMEAHTQQASEQGAQIIIFPELGTCGYDISREAVEDATSRENLVVKALSQAAFRYRIRVVASYPIPWAASAFENTYFSLGAAFAPSIPLRLPPAPAEASAPHTPAPDATSTSTSDAARPTPSPPPGDAAAPPASDVWLNVLICWDLEFPEPARCVRLSTPGTHHAAPLLICVPTANADGDVGTYTLRARACENHAFVLCANQAGAAFCGGTQGIGPDGGVLGQLPGTAEGLLLVECDVGHERYEATRKLNPMLEWRRPELYAAIGAEERWDKPSGRWGAGAGSGVA